MKTAPFFIAIAFAIQNISSQNLPKFNNIDSRRMTASGFSSGGTFTQQLQFSHPSLFTGIAVFSHTFYRCGTPNGVVADYDRVCTKLANATASELYNPDRVHDDIREYETKQLIGKTSLLKDKKLYVFSGLRNFLFSPEMSFNILRVYERYIRNPQSIRTRIMDAGLVMPTNNNQAPGCTAVLDEGSDFNANCGFSGAFEALHFLLGESCYNEPKSGQRIKLEALQEFNQEEFYTGIQTHQMDTKGYYYVPKGCQGRHKCLLHFFFHGCLNGRQFVTDKFIKGSGYLEVAELNNIIMVFPQALSSQPNNEIGCWDTFGISGPLYATKDGAQVKAVKKMIDKIITTGASRPSQSPVVEEDYDYQRPSNTGYGSNGGRWSRRRS